MQTFERLFIPVVCIFIAFLSCLSRRLTRQHRTRLTRCFLVILYCMGIFKQSVAIATGTYSPLYLPFHYSTTYYLTFSLYAFGHGRVRHFGACTSFAGGLLLLVTVLVSPVSVVGNPLSAFLSIYQFYSLFYHVVILLLFGVMCANADYLPQRADPLRYAAFLFCWLLLAGPAAYFFRFNYAGILYSYIPLLEQLRRLTSDGFYLAVYYLGTVAVCALSFDLYFRILYALRRKEYYWG